MKDIANSDVETETCEECGGEYEPDYPCCVFCDVCGIHYYADDPCPWH